MRHYSLSAGIAALSRDMHKDHHKRKFQHQVTRLLLSMLISKNGRPICSRAGWAMCACKISVHEADPRPGSNSLTALPEVLIPELFCCQVLPFAIREINRGGRRRMKREHIILPM